MFFKCQGNDTITTQLPTFLEISFSLKVSKVCCACQPSNKDQLLCFWFHCLGGMSCSKQMLEAGSSRSWSREAGQEGTSRVCGRGSPHLLFSSHHGIHKACDGSVMGRKWFGELVLSMQIVTKPLLAVTPPNLLGLASYFPSLLWPLALSGTYPGSSGVLDHRSPSQTTQSETELSPPFLFPPFSPHPDVLIALPRI